MSNLKKITVWPVFVTGQFQRRPFQTEKELNCLEQYMLFMYLL
jgi:hypothetical protein